MIQAAYIPTLKKHDAAITIRNKTACVTNILITRAVQTSGFFAFFRGQHKITASSQITAETITPALPAAASTIKDTTENAACSTITPLFFFIQLFCSAAL